MNRLTKERLIKLLRRKQELKQISYSPSEKQLMAHKHTGQFTVVLGGNRSGKTQSLCYEAVWWALGYHPYKELPFEPPIRVWIMCSTQEVGNDVIWGEKLKSIIPATKIARIRKAGPYVSAIELTNGSVISLKSYEKGEQALQSASVNFIGCDEQVSWDIYQELRQRISDIGGRIFFAFTPLVPDKDLQNYIDHKPIPGETCDQQDMLVVKMSRYDNPVFANKVTEIQQSEASMTDQQKATRIYGDWLLYSGRLIPHFTDKCILEPFTIPEFWRRAVMIDPATTGDAGVIWMAEDPTNGTWIQYKELLVAGLAPRELAQRIANESTGKYIIKGYDTASAWFAAEAQAVPFFKDSLVSIKKANQSEGMINVLNDRFFNGNYKILKSCQETCKQLQAYVNKPDSIKFDPMRGDDHLVDCWKYFTQIHPQFIAPKQAQTYTSMLWDAVRSSYGKPTSGKDPNLGFV